MSWCADFEFRVTQAGREGPICSTSNLWMPRARVRVRRRRQQAPSLPQPAAAQQPRTRRRLKRWRRFRQLQQPGVMTPMMESDVRVRVALRPDEGTVLNREHTRIRMTPLCTLRQRLV